MFFPAFIFWPDCGYFLSADSSDNIVFEGKKVCIDVTRYLLSTKWEISRLCS